jgi:HK97 family phage portal protein
MPGEYRVGETTVSADKAMTFIPFYAAVRNISEDIGGLPFGIYQKLPNGGRAEDESHPVHAILHDQANPYMSAMAFRETLQGHALTWGNGYAEIEYATDGSIMAVWPWRPDRVTVWVNDANQLMYRFYLKDGRYADLPRRKVFHVHGLGYDGIVGYSVIGVARHMLAVATNAQKTAERAYTRGIPPAVLKHPGTLGDPARTNLNKSIDSGDLGRTDRMALLEEGMDIKTIGLPPKDAMFLETGQMSRGLTATLLRIAPHMLQDVDRSTSWGSGIESQKIEYTSFTLGAWLHRWEQEAKMSLLRDEDRYARHTLDAFLRGASRDRWAAYSSGFDRGVWSVNDILAMEDRNPVPGGDQRFVPLNMMPLDQASGMTLEERIVALGRLVNSGFVPAASTDALDLPDIEHSGLPPVTVQPVSGGNGNGVG